MATRLRSGQAFYELAIGMLALALVLAALFSFAEYIRVSLDMQRRLRADAGSGAMGSVGASGFFTSAADSRALKLDPMAAEYIFGSETVTVGESVHMPIMGIAPGF